MRWPSAEQTEKDARGDLRTTLTSRTRPPVSHGFCIISLTGLHGQTGGAYQARRRRRDGRSVKAPGGRSTARPCVRNIGRACSRCGRACWTKEQREAPTGVLLVALHGRALNILNKHVSIQGFVQTLKEAGARWWAYRCSILTI
ncbi:unnamed protein product [Peniophora sp. CBMAI 1063]|nr:unnamed protein product [Peniophora sp. CBMAI 1063]